MAAGGELVSALGPRLSMRRTRRSSWMLSGWLLSAQLDADGGGTACMTLGCPDDFVAVRLGFPNVTKTPWRLERVIGRASAAFGDYVAPVGKSPWVGFTCRHGGKDSSGVVLGDGEATPIEVAARDESALARAAGVSWTWTDWAPIRSIAPERDGGMRVLMLRALVPSNQLVTYAHGQNRELVGNPKLNLGLDHFSGGIKFNRDWVSYPDGNTPRSRELWAANHIVPGTMFPMVQFLTQRAGICGVTVGDSHAQGTSTVGQFRSYGFHATAALIRRNRNAVPFSLVNCVCGGLDSETFFARFESLVHAVHPSYAVLPGWTFNDLDFGVHASGPAVERFQGSLLGALELCRRKGILPIVLTPSPRDGSAMGHVQLEAWLNVRQFLLGIAGSELVLDATPILARRAGPKFDGTYLSDMSDDLSHPNDAGHAAVGALLEDALSRLCNVF